MRLWRTTSHGRRPADTLTLARAAQDNSNPSHPEYNVRRLVGQFAFLSRAVSFGEREIWARRANASCSWRGKRSHGRRASVEQANRSATEVS
jgi:hypothetical protein